jgi:perosamine synthetase
MSATAGATSMTESVVDAIRSVVGDGAVSLHEPTFIGNEWAYVKECLDSTFVSSVGKFVEEFETSIAAFTGSAHAVAVVNGTAALHVALLLAGVTRDDEVLVPGMTFVATTNAIVYCGATPHFVDIEERTLGIDPHALRVHLGAIAEMHGGQCVNRRTGAPIRAVLPMHTFGHACDIDGILGVAHDFGLVVVEDAAESLGTFIGDRHTGTFGTLGTLSFNGNKTVTTGGGGAILTQDPVLARHAKHLTTTAKIPHRWAFMHDEVGYNYRLPNINAALGVAQMESLPRLIDAKRRLYERYAEAFARVAGVSVVREPERTRSNYWLQALRLSSDSQAVRDEILTATNAAGLMTRPIWNLMHTLAHFGDCPRMPLDVAERLWRTTVNIPSSAHLALSITR